MRGWIEENLEIYKARKFFQTIFQVLTFLQPDLRRLLWPIFVYSFLNIVSDFYPRESHNFFNAFKSHFENEHESDLRALTAISLPEHILASNVAKIYREAKYRVTLSQVAFYNLIQFLESKEKEGGAVIIGVIQSSLKVVTVEHTADDQHSLGRILQRARTGEDFPGEDEGIPGHNPGSANTDPNASSAVLTKLRLGAMPMDPDLMNDIRADLEEEDARNPPGEGQILLADHFEQRIKREESEDAPSRNDLALPQSLARDVAIEVQKIKENRDRFKLDGRTGGVGPGISVTMFTFHNTHDR